MSVDAFTQCDLSPQFAKTKDHKNPCSIKAICCFKDGIKTESPQKTQNLTNPMKAAEENEIILDNLGNDEMIALEDKAETLKRKNEYEDYDYYNEVINEILQQIDEEGDEGLIHVYHFTPTKRDHSSSIAQNIPPLLPITERDKKNTSIHQGSQTCSNSASNSPRNFAPNKRVIASSHPKRIINIGRGFQIQKDSPQQSHNNTPSKQLKKTIEQIYKTNSTLRSKNNQDLQAVHQEKLIRSKSVGTFHKKQLPIQKTDVAAYALEKHEVQSKSKATGTEEFPKEKNPFSKNTKSGGFTARTKPVFIHMDKSIKPRSPFPIRNLRKLNSSSSEKTLPVINSLHQTKFIGKKDVSLEKTTNFDCQKSVKIIQNFLKNPHKVPPTQIPINQQYIPYNNSKKLLSPIKDNENGLSKIDNDSIRAYERYLIQKYYQYPESGNLPKNTFSTPLQNTKTENNFFQGSTPCEFKIYHAASKSNGFEYQNHFDSNCNWAELTNDSKNLNYSKLKSNIFKNGEKSYLLNYDKEIPSTTTGFREYRTKNKSAERNITSNDSPDRNNGCLNQNLQISFFKRKQPLASANNSMAWTQNAPSVTDCRLKIRQYERKMSERKRKLQVEKKLKEMMKREKNLKVVDVYRKLLLLTKEETIPAFRTKAVFP